MVIAILYAVWGILTSSLGPMLFVNFSAMFAVWLLIVNQVSVRRLLRKRERGELPLPEELTERSALRAKLAAIEDIRPRLVDEPMRIARTLTTEQHRASYPDQNQAYRQDRAFFLLLRIKNVPESTNSLAIARNVYAEISYFGSQGGDELFPAVTGAWVTPDGDTSSQAIGGISSECPDLRPSRDLAYLGIAIGYFLNSSAPKEYAALTASSPRYRDWMDLGVLLNNRVSDGIVNVKVTLGCDGFRTTNYYILKVNEAKRNFPLRQHLTLSILR